MNNDLKTSYGVYKNGKIYCPNCRRLIVDPVILLEWKMGNLLRFATVEIILRLRMINKN